MAADAASFTGSPNALGRFGALADERCVFAARILPADSVLNGGIPVSRTGQFAAPKTEMPNSAARGPVSVVTGAPLKVVAL
jgi:hypothetical protein